VPLKGEQNQGELATIPNVLPDDLLGCTVLLPPNDDGECLRATIVKKIIKHDQDVDGQPAKIQFLVSVGEDRAEEIYTYTDLVDFLNQEILVKDIIAHQGPLKPGDCAYKRSMWNVMVAWEDGSETYKPLHLIGKDSPVIVAHYAKEHGLLDQPGWKHFK